VSRKSHQKPSLWARITGKHKLPAQVAPAPRTAVVVADLFEEGQAAVLLLRKLGFEGTLVVGGEQGLTQLQGNSPPDLVFLDCWESRLGGLSLLQVVAHYHPNLPERVVARVPGGASSAIGNELMALGVRAVVPERMTPSILAEAILQATGEPVPRDLVDAIDFKHRDKNAPRQDDELPQGTLIADRYNVQGWLGRGNCATVHRVIDEQTGEELALKLLLPDAAVVNAGEQLHIEYAIGAQIAHSNVLRAHSEGTAYGRPFIVLELLQGSSLEDHIREYGIPEPALLPPLLLSAARGLAAMHAAGVVHRDVKPGNLFLDGKTAQLKLIDFGVALAPGITPPDKKGTVLGTPAYVSPEQLQGTTPGTPASDIFALGVVFYEVLAGRRPFRGRTVQQLLGRIAKAPPVAPRKLNPAVPRDLSDLVLRMLNKEPTQRPTAKQVAAVLEEVAWRWSVDVTAETVAGPGPLHTLDDGQEAEVPSADSMFGLFTIEDELDAPDPESGEPSESGEPPTS